MLALCAFIRMVLCAISVCVFEGTFYAVILDQVSLPIPLLRLRYGNVFFYCHYPDKLLSTNRASIIMKVYRFFLDFAEEITTAMAKVIVVNSHFTREVFRKNFKLISKFMPGKLPSVVYPAIKMESFKKSSSFSKNID